MDTAMLLHSFTENPGMFRWTSSYFPGGWGRFGSSYRPKSNFDLERLVEKASERLEKDMSAVRQELPAVYRDLFQVLPGQAATVLPGDLQKLAKVLWKTRTNKTLAKRHQVLDRVDTITLLFTTSGLHIEETRVVEGAVAETGLAQGVSSQGDRFQATINRTAFYELAKNYLDKGHRVTFHLGHKSDRLEMRQPGWRVNFRLQEVL